MTIGRTDVLLGLLGLMPIIALQIRSYLLGRKDIAELGKQWPEDSMRTVFMVKWFFSALAFNLFFVFALLSLSDITWGQYPAEEERSGLDLVIVIDVSRSMLVEDLSGSRLQESEAIVRGLTRQLPAARMALIAFKGEAVTLMPLTEDIAAVEAILDGLSPSLISRAGTDLERGLLRAIERFPSGSSSSRAILLLSDGEALTGSVSRPVDLAQEQGIPIYTVVVGTETGGTVPGPDGSAILDENQRPVVSQADPQILAEVAAETGARVFRLEPGSTVDDLSQELGRFARQRESQGYRLVPRRRYRLFLAIALISLGVSLVVRFVRWRDMF